MNVGYRIFAFLRRQIPLIFIDKKINTHLDRYTCSKCPVGHVDVDWSGALPIQCYCDTCEQMYQIRQEEDE